MISKPWLDHYDEGIPKTLEPYPRQTLVDVVDETTRMRPNHTALIFKGERISYGELAWRSDALADGAGQAGRQEGRSGCHPDAQLPAVRDRRVRDLEGGRDRGFHQPAVHRAGARTRAQRMRRRDGDRPHPVLQQGEGRSSQDEAEARHRHQHQGVSAQDDGAAVYAGQGKEGRPPRAVTGWRPVVRRPDPPAHRRAAAAGGGRAG